MFCRQINIFSLIVLILLMNSAFTIRTENHLASTSWTVDEGVYHQLGLETKINPFYYNTITFADDHQKAHPQAPRLPDYFYQPLFKHPPVFPWFMALSFQIFGETPKAAIVPSALFGSLLILIGYLFGRLFFNEGIGLFTAFALWLDPNNIICSQKIWMETTLSFFTLLTLYFFAYGLKHRRDFFFILSGVASGLAALTKYPGLLGTGIIVAYAFFFEPRLFKNKKFVRGIILPVVLLLPWVMWNFYVFGFNLWLIELHLTPQRILAAAAIITGFWGIGFFLRRKTPRQASPDHNPDQQEESTPADRIRHYLLLFYGLLFFLALSPQLHDLFFLDHIPFVTWYGGRFQHPLFYFGRMIEFSGLYIFAFIPFFLRQDKIPADEIFLRLAVVIFFAFYILWGNFQSRYVLVLPPLLLVLAIKYVADLYERISRSAHDGLRWLGWTALSCLLLFFFLKTSYINFLVSYPNDMCYF